jgi:hypothetical protein
MEITIGLNAETKTILSKLILSLDNIAAVNAMTSSAATQIATEGQEATKKPAKKRTANKTETAPATVTTDFGMAEDPMTDTAPTVSAATSFDDDDFMTAAPTAAPAKKVTADDVNDACKTKAASIGGKGGREAIFNVLKKQFGVASVTELKAEQYAAVIEAIEAI